MEQKKTFYVKLYQFLKGGNKCDLYALAISNLRNEDVVFSFAYTSYTCTTSLQTRR